MMLMCVGGGYNAMLNAELVSCAQAHPYTSAAAAAADTSARLRVKQIRRDTLVSGKGHITGGHASEREAREGKRERERDAGHSVSVFVLLDQVCVCGGCMHACSSSSSGKSADRGSGLRCWSRSALC